MKIIKNWWIFTIIGVLITISGVWVYKNPIENYIGLSVLFSVVLFFSGIFEITFALTNRSNIKGWGWMLSSGIFDLIIGFYLIMKENITMELLPFIFGIWLIFRGIQQFSRGFLLKDAHIPNWGWSMFGGIVVTIFGFMVMDNPVFGSESIIIWTSLALIFLGTFTIIFSFLLKKLET
jgi:uncharacterized membrane protein HdeD (DUF308 family)